MSLIDGLRHRALLLPDAFTGDITGELQHHLDLETLAQRGASPTDASARLRARRETLSRR